MVGKVKRPSYHPRNVNRMSKLQSEHCKMQIEDFESK